MDCTTWHEAMSARLDGEASTADDDALDRHLRACADCSALLVDLTALHRRFRLHPAPQVPDLVLAALASAERLDDVSAAGAAPKAGVPATTPTARTMAVSQRRRPRGACGMATSVPARA